MDHDSKEKFLIMFVIVGMLLILLLIFFIYLQKKNGPSNITFKPATPTDSSPEKNNSVECDATNCASKYPVTQDKCKQYITSDACGSAFPCSTPVECDYPTNCASKYPVTQDKCKQFITSDACGSAFPCPAPVECDYPTNCASKYPCTAANENNCKQFITSDACGSAFPCTAASENTCKPYITKNVCLSTFSELRETGTQEPVTQEPGTYEPGTYEPGTYEPGTYEPGTYEPETQEPVTQEPVTYEPGTYEPGTYEPETQEPGTQETDDPFGLNTVIPDYTPNPEYDIYKTRYDYGDINTDNANFQNLKPKLIIQHMETPFPAPAALENETVLPPKVDLTSSPLSMMGDNDWIFMLKLGDDSDTINCNDFDGGSSCKFLYASSTQPELTLINGIRVDTASAERNPAYQFYLLTNDTYNNRFITWNDQSSRGTCDGNKGSAHDKGGIVYNLEMTEGVYMQHSNPNWGVFDHNNGNEDDLVKEEARTEKRTYFIHTPVSKNKRIISYKHEISEKPFPIEPGFLRGGWTTTTYKPGLRTDLAQHLVFVKLTGADTIKNMIIAMNNANLCQVSGNDSENDGFKPCYSSCDYATTNNTLLSKISELGDQKEPTFESGDSIADIGYVKIKANSVTDIISKPRGFRGYDAWGYVNNQTCNINGDGGQLYAYTFCTPACPLGTNKSRDSVNNIIDVSNQQGHMSDKTYYSIYNENNRCSISGVGENNKLGNYHQNHSKIGVCTAENSDYVIISGNNHSANTQGPRGGLFVIIKNKLLASKLRCLFAPVPDE